MSKWKCDICGKEFDNFHAQGFDNKVYCPLCFFKEENRRLKEKINTYEDPEDLTLMFMYCDEKAKDKIKQLKEIEKEHQKINGELREENKKLKEVIDEAREYVNKHSFFVNDTGHGKIIGYPIDSYNADNLLQILDKATKENK